MAMPIALPLALIGGGLFLLTRDDKKEATGQPVFSNAQKDGLTVMKTLPDGTQARYFSPQAVNAIMGALGQRALVPVAVQGGQAPGLLFKVAPLQGIAVSAQAGAQAANSQNFVVMGTLSLALLGQDDGSDKFLMFVSASQRSLANASGEFAILLDSGPSPVASTTPASPTGVVPPPPFDHNLPPELVKLVNAFLSDPNAEPEALELAANDLEANGFPIAAGVLRDRAKNIWLQRELKNKAAGGTPFTIRGNASNTIAKDLPFATAKHYTGDGMRWKEIAGVNSKLGMVVTGGKNANLSPWKPGLTILLPLSWEADKKPLPPI